MNNDLKTAYTELYNAFMLIPVEDKRKEIINKLEEIVSTLNSIKPNNDIVQTNNKYNNEDEFLCSLHNYIYNLEQNLGNIFSNNI